MKDFKKILNKIAAYSLTKASSAAGPCCRAHFKFNSAFISDVYILYDATFIYVTQSYGPQVKKRFSQVYEEILADYVIKFLSNICYCKIPFDVVSTANPEVYGPDDYLNPPTLPENAAEIDCAKALGQWIRGFDTFSANPNDIIAINDVEDAVNITDPQILNNLRRNFVLAVRAFIESAKKTVNSANYPGAYPPSAVSLQSSNSFSSFVNGFCLLRNLDRLAVFKIEENYRQDIKGFDPLKRSILDTFYQGLIKTSDTESLTANCPPSTGDESVIGLLGALGVGAAGVTAVGYLGAILKGNVKKCANKRQAAQIATTKLLALLGVGVGSFSATQVSEAEIVDRVEDIIIKDCEGRLPYDCGGFEGGDDDESGGPVDPPGGGEVGGIGGGLL